ncbi:site-specific DNA-methyltransferase [Amycolatopsis sp. WAC 04182]|uniref:DNA-methyltransferase n=1 Tax=Amycolatopsis sp. WAC 04182 TaxID=2203198 RepID=UPI000F792F53|nr:site-specific DNA-methyltransferase [Amycolatopsis sp. WAC 04182]RSN58835.1 site-specific DNA-methyltransferase [Amycolatopsis sp. WAC 04182]
MAEYYRDETLTLHQGDAADVLRTLEPGSVNAVVTSPPYFGLRDYGDAGQIGHEPTVAEYVERLVSVFAEVRRVLADDGLVWLNLGDAYTAKSGPLRAGATGTRPKNLIGLPWKVAFALQADGWFLRNAIVWAKPNAMPESVQDRFSNRHESVFLLTKSNRYRFNLDAVREPYTGDRSPSRRARKPGPKKANSVTSVWPPPGHEDRGHNPGDVWTLPTQPFKGAHFAPMPLRLAERCVAASVPSCGAHDKAPLAGRGAESCGAHPTILDPFCGSGTSLVAARAAGLRAIGVDLNPDYLALALDRCRAGK